MGYNLHQCVLLLLVLQAIILLLLVLQVKLIVYCCMIGYGVRKIIA